MDDRLGAICFADHDTAARTASRLNQAVASVLGISEQARQPLMDVLTDGLRSHALLLVLHNCEHLVDSCGELAQRLLQHCPELRILATSREPLGVAGETTWRVPPLGLPERRADLPAAMVAQSEAARLFAQRASAALPGFSLAQHAATVARICWQVDGIPLALELAAVGSGCYRSSRSPNGLVTRRDC